MEGVMVAWKKMKAVLSTERAIAPRPKDVLVSGPAPVEAPTPCDRRHPKKRALLLAGLLEATSRKKGSL